MLKKEVRVKGGMARVLEKEEEKEVRSLANATTVAVKVIQRETARTWGKGSKGHVSHAEERGTVQPSVPQEKVQEEEKWAI